MVDGPDVVHLKQLAGKTRERTLQQVNLSVERTRSNDDITQANLYLLQQGPAIHKLLALAVGWPNVPREQ